MDMEGYKAALDALDVTFLHIHSAFCKNALEFEPGQRGVITNGKAS